MDHRPSTVPPTRVDPNLLPLARLYQWEQAAPTRICMTQPFDGGQLRDYTWREAAEETRRAAAWLRAQGWPAGTRIALLGKNSAGWIMADLAIWMAGYVSVPLYPLQTAENVRQIVEHSGAAACFVGKLDDTAMLGGIADTLPVISLPLAPRAVLERATTSWGDILAHVDPFTDSPCPAGDALCTIVYTSGTTGQAKGVMHSFATMTAGLLAADAHVHYAADDRMISYLPLAHIIERSLLELAFLHSGCRVWFTESLDTFVADLRRARPTLFVSVPRLWLKFRDGVLAKMPARKLDRLLAVPLVGRLVGRKVLRGLGLAHVRRAASGSAPLSVDILRWYARLGLEIAEGYGMTELGCASHSNLAGRLKFGTVGRPLAGVRHRIDPDSGEVQVQSPAATLGYYREPEMTLALFTADGWLRSGDKGTLDADDRLTLVGRIKDNFKSSKGKYVAPGPIENKLLGHPALEACLVAGSGLPQPLAIAVLSAAAATGGGREALTAELERHLAAVNVTLDPHERLDCLVLTREPWTPENGLLTPTLKVRRAQVEQRFTAQVERWAATGAKVIWADEH